MLEPHGLWVTGQGTRPHTRFVGEQHEASLVPHQTILALQQEEHSYEFRIFKSRHSRRLPDGAARVSGSKRRLILTDPPYLAGYRDRSSRTVHGDTDNTWLKPAFAETFRVLKRSGLCVSFYGWHKVDQFVAAWKAAGLRPVGRLVRPKRYVSRRSFVLYQHESAYLLAKG